jgi:glycosyltransferase
MLFSIITVCYNAAPTIRTTIESVLSQDYPDIEYIVSDGGSTDGSVEIIRSYKSGITHFTTGPDGGHFDALNKSINRAKGEVIGILHADDFYAYPHAISDVAKRFADTPADSVHGDLVYVSQHNTDKIVRYWRSGPFHPKKLSAGWMPPHPAFFLKRRIYNRMRLRGGEYFDMSFKISGDYDFMMRVLKKYRITTAYLPKVLVKMRTGGKSNKSLANLICKSAEDLRAMRNNGVGGFGTLLSKNLRKLPQFFMNDAP